MKIKIKTQNERNNKPLLLSIFAIMFIFAFIGMGSSAVSFENNSPTPQNNSRINSINFLQNYTIISNATLLNTYFNFNGTLYELYNKNNHLFCMNLDNSSSSGESATNVYDWCSGQNGSVNGASLVKGIYGNAYYFDGTDDFLNTSGVPQISFNYTNDYSIEFWLNTTSWNSTLKGVLWEHFSGAHKIFDISMSNSTLQLSGFNSACGTNNYQAPHTMSLNKWHKINYVWNKTGNLLYTYVDGVLLDTDTTTGTTGVCGTVRRMFIGSSNSNTLNYNGIIDGIKIINRTLSNNEIKINSFVYGNVSGLNNIIINKSIPFAYQNFSYYIISNNSEGTTNNSNINLISRNSRIVSIIANFSNSRFLINDYVYGVNFQRPWTVNGTTIDVSGDGVKETSSNYTWHEQYFNSSGLNTIRMDLGLQNLYSNSSNGLPNLTSSIERYTLQAQYCYINNCKITLIINNMPQYLADNSTGMCSNLAYCPPNNYTKWNAVVMDAINRISNNGTYISIFYFEIWNEPEAGFFMGGLSVDNIAKAGNYSVLYNQTRNIIKTSYPTAYVGGYAATNVLIYPNFFNTFLSNFSNQMDFFSYHYYSQNLSFDLVNITTYVQQKCTQYSANCTLLLLDEFNSNSATIMNTTSEQSRYSQIVSGGFLNMIKNYGSIINLQLFKWSAQWKYSNISVYDTYPERYDLVSEPNLDNKLYTSYSVVYNFTRYAPSGYLVYNSSDDYISVDSICSSNSNIYNCVLVNYEEDYNNLTVNVGAYKNNSYWIDTQNGNLFLPVNGVLYISDVEPYLNKYVTTPVFNITESSNILNKNNYLGEVLGTSTNEIWFSFSNDTEKHIASNLTVAVNATVIISAESSWGSGCEFVNYLSYTPNGSSSLVYTGDQARGICSELISTGYVLQINPSVESNELIITSDEIAILACNDFTLAGYRIVIILASVTILLFMGFFVYRQGFDITIGQIIMLFISVIVALILWQASGQNLAASCTF